MLGLKPDPHKAHTLPVRVCVLNRFLPTIVPPSHCACHLFAEKTGSVFFQNVLHFDLADALLILSFCLFLHPPNVQ